MSDALERLVFSSCGALFQHVSLFPKEPPRADCEFHVILFSCALAQPALSTCVAQSWQLGFLAMASGSSSDSGRMPLADPGGAGSEGSWHPGWTQEEVDYYVETVEQYEADDLATVKSSEKKMKHRGRRGGDKSKKRAHGFKG